MNPIFVWSALVISAIIIQTTILVDFFVNGLKPDLLLIIVVLTSIILGKHHGVTIGFFSGLLEDLLSTITPTVPSSIVMSGPGIFACILAL